MAVVYTVINRHSSGDLFAMHGTFTSAAGDGAAETLTPATHGLNYLAAAEISLDPAALGTQRPKVTISGGTVTWSVDDTQGMSGRWRVVGR
jgi:hypothetical protein